MRLLRCCVAEMIGTFFLTFVGAGAIVMTAIPESGAALITVALAHGLALSMAVYATGHISGGHINPAVTVAMLVRGKIKPPDAAGYVVAQLVGAVLAALCVNGCFPAEPVAAVKIGATLGSLSAANPGATLVIEAILTFLLVTTIFAVAVDSRGAKNIYGFAIGLTVTFDILCAGPITGASMNPARSFGPALVDGSHWGPQWIYWVGPIIGACVAAVVYDLVLIPRETKESRGS
ncbi:MAG: aquaporin [Planctomycetota bacterium]|nr:aquaporin [Planctomycetota bacterium]